MFSTPSSVVETNVYNIRSVGIYVENGQEMQNNFVNNAIGCESMSGCPCEC